MAGIGIKRQLLVLLLIVAGCGVVAAAVVGWIVHRNSYTYSDMYRAYVRKAHNEAEFTACAKKSGAGDMGQPDSGLVVCMQPGKYAPDGKPYALTWPAPTPVKLATDLQVRTVPMDQVPVDLKTIIINAHDSVTQETACHPLPLPQPTVYMAGDYLAASTPINCTNHFWLKTAKGWQSEVPGDLTSKCSLLLKYKVPLELLIDAQLSTYCVDDNGIVRQLALN